MVSYDDAGKQVSAVHTDEIYPGYAYTNFTETYALDEDGKLSMVSYDPLSTGEVKATETVIWEQGPCFEFYLPQYGEPILPGMRTGYNPLFPAGFFINILGCNP